MEIGWRLTRRERSGYYDADFSQLILDVNADEGVVRLLKRFI